MNLNELDVELFISEVKKRPELWDVNSDDYRFVKKKRRAWMEIATVCINDFNNSTWSEKLIHRKLHEKWRSLRDSYVRAKRLKSTRYAYKTHLSFLDINYDHAKLSPSEEKMHTIPECTPELVQGINKSVLIKTEPVYTTDDCYAKLNEATGGRGANTVSKHGSTKNGVEFIDTTSKYPELFSVSEIELEGVDVADINSRYPEISSVLKNEPNDEDRCFFESLLPAVRQFDIDQKLEFRCDILALIRRIRSKNFDVDSNKSN